ncbi:MAG: PEGA domain-containing protein [Elusimicrobiota bacterium]|nr:PEGA domain-containing protein [Elusimicrobiota bacterium]
MKKTVLGTILAVNTVLLLAAGNIIYQEASSPLSGVKTKAAPQSEKAPEKKAPAPTSEKKPQPGTDKTDPAAYLSINSVPSTAKVFINGYHKAQTPASIKIVSVSEVPRQYSIKLFKEGYYPWEKMVTLTRGSAKEFSVNLKKK